MEDFVQDGEEDEEVVAEQREQEEQEEEGPAKLSASSPDDEALVRFERLACLAVICGCARNIVRFWLFDCSAFGKGVWAVVKLNEFATRVVFHKGLLCV